ncbi:uncharacterized protein [Porites lutea]|uniref:uncharacterized protein n=1 Tax=Porites lutea TaxID=51062 RepID=UPI003CC56C36
MQFIVLRILLELLPWIRGQVDSNEDTCRHLEWRANHIFEGKRLKHHVIRSIDALDAKTCEIHCFFEPDCASFNFKKSSMSPQCELNNATVEEQDDKLETKDDYIYQGAENKCVKNLCKNKATCQTGFTDKGYRCMCAAGFKGEYCEIVVDECAAGTHNCSANTFCTNNAGSYTCTCNPGYYGGVDDCEPISTGQDIFDKSMKNTTQMITIIFDSKPTSVLCHMGDFGCGDGGWTPVMKMDGKKQTFLYYNALWKNKKTFNLDGGKTGFDSQETKLPSYWNTSFSKICLGMNIGHQIKFIVINKQANSLYSLIADGQYRSTSLGRDTWKSLIGSKASLQYNCNKEGFNAVCSNLGNSKARIGIITNNDPACTSCGSRIRFGTGGYPDKSSSCGNEASTSAPDNGEKHIKTMGYILVQ